MPQNLICLVKWSDRFRDPSQGQPPRRTGGGRGIQPRKPHGDRLKGGEAVASLAHMPDRFQFDGNIQPQPSSTVNTRTPSVPHMRLGAWVMISPTWGFPPRRRQRWGEKVVLAHHPEHPLAGNTDATTDPKPSPDLAVTYPSQGDACRSASMASSRASQIVGFGPRPICWWALRGGLLPGFHRRLRKERAKRRTDPLEAVATRAGREARHSSESSAAQRAGRLRLGLQQFHLQINSPIRFMAMSSSAFTGSPLRSLSEASIPAIAFSRQSSRKSPRDADFHRLGTAGQPH